MRHFISPPASPTIQLTLSNTTHGDPEPPPRIYHQDSRENPPRIYPANNIQPPALTIAESRQVHRPKKLFRREINWHLHSMSFVLSISRNTPPTTLLLLRDNTQETVFS
jgi:hypothetical protein